MLDIAIIIPELAKYGGAERLVIECVRRWQHFHKITLYSTKINKALLREHGVKEDVTLKLLTSGFDKEKYSFLLNSILLPEIWSREIGKHDIYNTHLWPTHLINVSPMVWYPHEPLRLLYDLRYNQKIEDLASDQTRKAHIYPKYSYDSISADYYDSMLTIVQKMDKYRTPERIVANSKYSANYLERVYKTRVKDIVYPGVNVDDFLPPISFECVLTVAQLWPHKRLRLIIESIKLTEGLQLYIVGSGPEKNTLINLSKNLGVSDRVFFLEKMSNIELKIVFSRALAVVFTPIREPFGIVALEAMAAGKPLIAVNEGGFTEVVDSSCCFLVPPSPIAIAEKLTYLQQHVDVAMRMGESGRERAKQFTWDKTADQLVNILQETYIKHESKKKSHKIAEELTTLFGIHYYCWYGNGYGSRHWNDNQEFGGVTQMPVLGYYASYEEETIRSHFSMLKEVGFDFIICNLHIAEDGLDIYEFEVIKRIFQVNTKMGKESLNICIQLCFQEIGETSFIEAVKRIKATFFDQDMYLHYHGKPVLFIFWTGKYDNDEAFISLLKEIFIDTFLIASSLRLYDERAEQNTTFGLFDGWCLYSPLELAGPEKRKRVWRIAYDNFKSGKSAVRIFTVSPGYDDRHLISTLRQGNPHRLVERNGGSTYKEMTEYALSLREAPDFIIVSTFNEFHENTHIEPTIEIGSLYMDITRDFIKSGKKRWRKR